MITLHQRGAALYGVLTQGAGRYQVTGTYDPATRTMRFAVPLASGDSVQAQAALTPDYRQGAGSEEGADIDGGLALVRVGDLGSAALPPAPLPRTGSGTLAL